MNIGVCLISYRCQDIQCTLYNKNVAETDVGQQSINLFNLLYIVDAKILLNLMLNNINESINEFCTDWKSDCIL